MESTLVSARNTQAKKEAGVNLLASLGVSTSDLINSAFDYLLAHQALPANRETPAVTSADFARFVEASTLDIAWGDDAADGDYRALMRDRRRADYESLA